MKNCTSISAFTAMAAFWIAGALSLQGQAPGPQQLDVRINLDSGELVNLGDSRSVIFSEIVEVRDASWVRLRFDDPRLGKVEEGGTPTILRITSLYDGAVQTLNEIHLTQWRDTSAYFNGDAVLVEIIADSGASSSRLTATSAWVGPLDPEMRSICGPTDDRTLSSDPRMGRVEPIGCTGWLIDDANHCFLTAGHCDPDMQVVEFNVPLSLASGAVQHPGPEDQYPIDPLSIQSNGGLGIGNDWNYFGCFPNSTTGLTAVEAQGDFFVLADPPASPAGQDIRITGYGTTTLPVSNTWNQVQKTHLGPLNSVSGNTVNYQTDTTGGNSGSPIIHENTGNAIGIHTHAGCSVGGGGNNGTNILHPALQAALADPQGVCRPPAPLAFNFPNGLPVVIEPDGGTIRVEVVGQNGGIPQPGTGKLRYLLDEGGLFTEVNMTVISPNVYDAPFPVVACGTHITYEFTAETMDSQVVTSPDSSPNNRYQVLAASGLDVTFSDNFETDQGWTVQNDGALTDGAWTRGLPIGGGLRGDPTFDADGSGNCFLTDNEPGNSDVDGGHTILVSPLMDASQGDGHICYWRWFSNNAGSAPDEDVMVVQISNDDGANWTTLETVGPTGPEAGGGWFFKSFRIADFLTPTDQFRIRFDVSDLLTGSVVEAAIDGVRLKRSAEGFLCDTFCLGDLNADMVVDGADLFIGVSLWGGTVTPGDVNGDGRTNVLDLIGITEVFGGCNL